MARAKLILIVIICLCSYLYFSNPDTVVINEKGKVDGLVNKARAVLQCEKFWRYQLNRANEKHEKRLSSLSLISDEMQEMREIEKGLPEIEKILDDKMKELYTPEQQMAESLRRKADSIESAGTWRLVDEMLEKKRLKEIEDTKIIIPIIEAKRNVAKPWFITPIFLLACVLGFALLVLIPIYQHNKKRYKT